MKQISILGENRISIGYKLQSEITKFVSNSRYSTIVLVSDIVLEQLGHVKALLQEIEKSGKRILTYCIPDGEVFKTRDTKEGIEDFLLQNLCHRDTLIIAFGGGVVGDLVGFTASTYMRGVPIVQIPTTLLAMVDSSIGGKTGLDTIYGKNLIGAFHQPLHIFIDVEYLKTLTMRHFCNGMAEVIKTAAIANATEFAFLEENADLILSIMEHPSQFNEEAASLLIHIAEESARIKADIVTKDEKEGGLRGLLNFGHTIGHGIEAAVFPDLLHGECVSLGMVIEGEISRHLNHLSNISLGRLERLLKAFQLPTDFFSKSTRSLFKGRDVSVTNIMQFIARDKKNSKSNINLVLLQDIGSTVELKASTVASNIIHLHLCKGIQIHPFKHAQSSFICPVPGSKSISNRVLLMAALGKGTVIIHNLLHSEDTQVMLNALKMLNACSFEYLKNGTQLVIHGGNGQLSLPDKPIFISNAGTAARFLTTMLNLLNGSVILTGNERMKLRPIHPLVEALQQANCQINYIEQQGFLPLQITATGLQGGTIELDAKISSQYVSSILISAPYAKTPITLILKGTVISRQYIDMTILMMKSFGVDVSEPQINTFTIPLATYTNPTEYHVEPDASSATYPLSFAAITNTTVTVPHLGKSSCQGDAQFAQLILSKMDCSVVQDALSTTVTGTPHLKPVGPVNMEILTDAFLTAAVINGPITGDTTITGIANQRVKECNRILAIKHGLEQFGIHSSEIEDGMIIHGQKIELKESNGRVILCEDDHRVAMSFSLLGCKFGCILDDRKCVSKTFPEWFDVLRNTFKVEMSGVEMPEHEEESVEDKKNIYIIGMRGVGKTTFGKYAANQLGYGFIDVDDAVTKDVGCSIKEYIDRKGWDGFREAEFRILESLRVSKSIISCGGGITSYKPSLSWLQNTNDLVILLTRDVLELATEFENDVNRPQYNRPFMDVYNERLVDYKSASDYEYIMTSKTDIAVLKHHFTDWLHSILTNKVVTMPSYGCFLCCTMPNYTFIDNELLLLSMDAANLVEIRLDLIQPQTSDAMGQQLFYLQQITNKSLIGTIRTKSEGGFYDGDFHAYFDNLINLLKWNIKYIDVEYNMFTNKRNKLQELVKLANFYKIQIIMSWHERGNDTNWQDMRIIANQMQLYGAVKIIGIGNDVPGLLQFKKWFSNNFTKPLICCYMGDNCQYSRVICDLVPVTHELYNKAAPGQMSFKEINMLRGKLHLIETQQFYLVGTPISQSMSPLLHNTGYKITGLPHLYKLMETHDLKQFATTMQQSDFGGCSVTIPFKQVVMELCDVISEDAMAIGAVNTIIKEDNKFIGYNTDYKGIMACGNRLTNGVDIVSVLVIGGGGTARAACYAVRAWGYKLNIYNRTTAKAEELARQFDGTCVNGIEGEYDMVISTIPYGAQGTTKLPKTDYLIELSYTREKTAFMKQVAHSVSGIEVLIEQGICQFEIFTKMVAPQLGMRKAVLEAFYKK